MLVTKRLAGMKLALAVIVAAGALGMSVGSAAAAPTNGLSGLFGECTNGASGTFIVNSGNSHAAQTWNVAHLWFSTGGTGIFVPSALDLSYNESPPVLVTKGNAPGNVTCAISADEGGFTLSGWVTGRMVVNG